MRQITNSCVDRVTRHDDRLTKRSESITHRMEARSFVEHILRKHGNVHSEADLKTKSASAVMKLLADDVMRSSGLAADVD